MNSLVKLYQTINGPMYLLETDTVICESLRTTGDYAPDEKALLGSLITSGDTILDVGANVGNHTLFFSQCVGPEGRVLSFEPQRFLFNILCANALLGRYQNVWPYRLAVGDRRERSIYLFRTTTGPITLVDTRCHLTRSRKRVTSRRSMPLRQITVTSSKLTWRAWSCQYSKEPSGPSLALDLFCISNTTDPNLKMKFCDFRPINFNTAYTVMDRMLSVIMWMSHRRRLLQT